MYTLDIYWNLSRIFTAMMSYKVFFFSQCVPYLIAMGTDPEPAMRNKADQQLVEIDKKYAGFIHVSAFSKLLLL